MQQSKPDGLARLVVPAVLEQDVEVIKSKLGKIKGKSRAVHVDILDGVFADNTTVSVDDLKQVELDEFKVDVHLMVEYPDEYLGECHTMGADRVFGQIERMNSQEEFVELCEDLNIKPGLAVDLYTPIESVGADLFGRLGGILLMGVKAGFSGQEFQEVVVEKIGNLRKVGFTGNIQIDGGMNPKTSALCFGAGANEFAVTSYLWGAGDIDKALALMRESVGINN